MNIWVAPLCAILILFTSCSSFPPVHKPIRPKPGKLPAGAVVLYHTQQFRKHPYTFGTEEVIYTTTLVKNNPPTLVIHKLTNREPFTIPVIWYMNESFTPPMTPPPASSEATTDATLNPTHMVLPVVLGGILDQIMPYTGKWAIVCSAVSYLMRAVPVFLAIRSLDLGFGVPSKAHVMATPDRVGKK